MPRSSGTYSLPLPNVQAAEVISATWANTTLTDVATALTNSLSKDGQTAPTTNLPMGTYKFTGVSNGDTRTQYLTAGQLSDGAALLVGSISGTNTLTGSLSIPIVSFTTGMRFNFIPANSNSGATTLSINGLTAKSITKLSAAPLTGGDLLAGNPAEVVYDGTRFVLLNPCSDLFPATLYKTANETVSNSATLQNDDHFSVSVYANSKYAVELYLRIGSDTPSEANFQAAAFQCAFSLPSGASGFMSHLGGNSGDMASALVVSVSDIGGGMYVINGYLETVSAGALQFQWAQSLARNLNTILYAGSHMVVRGVG